MEQLASHFLYVGVGLACTLELLVGGLLISLILGTLLSILRYSGVGCMFIKGFVSIIRGTPVILQLSLVYFTVPAFTGIKLSTLSAGILTFGINSAAYVTEILRGGIESLPKGQFEAAQTLGIPRFYTWKDIILPQVTKSVFPSMVGEVIAFLKETALISTIGGMDVMRASQMLAAEQFTYFMPLCIAGIYYYTLVLLIEYIGKRVERAYDQNPPSA
ncbi:MAG: amino acid ABC transporter permease [Holosporales bacterium]|jgi:polar amino acid transport system permease protein|nr:amino acid ABC transporter permease [Holosporales bacterium]